MSHSLSSSCPRPISFLDAYEFLGHDTSRGRVDSFLNGGVKLSAIPDGSGGTKWEARTKEGKALPMFRLTIKREAAKPETLAARGPVVIDATEGVYVCYEDEARQQSWCVKVK